MCDEPSASSTPPEPARSVASCEEVCCALSVGAIEHLWFQIFGGRRHGESGRRRSPICPASSTRSAIAEVPLDSGVRRGTDIAAALALGARAVLIGHGWLYGVAAAGEAGVRHAVDLLADDCASL
jgi:(S)-mandelate dehydrogenase